MSQYHSQVQEINNRITEISVATKVYSHEVYDDVITALWKKWGIPALNHDGDGFSGADGVGLDELIELTNRLNAEFSDGRDLYVTPIADCYIEEEDRYDFSPLITALDRLFIHAYQEALNQLEAKVIDLGYGNIHLATELRKEVMEAFDSLRADETPFKTSDSLEGWREFVEANISLFVYFHCNSVETDWDRAVEKFLSPQNETNLNWLYNYLEQLADEYIEEVNTIRIDSSQLEEIVRESVNHALIDYDFSNWHIPIYLDIESGETTAGGWLSQGSYQPDSIVIGKIKAWNIKQDNQFETFFKDVVVFGGLYDSCINPEKLREHEGEDLSHVFFDVQDLTDEGDEAFKSWEYDYNSSCIHERIETEIEWIKKTILEAVEDPNSPLCGKKVIIEHLTTSVHSVETIEKMEGWQMIFEKTERGMSWLIHSDMERYDTFLAFASEAGIEVKENALGYYVKNEDIDGLVGKVETLYYASQSL